MAVNQQELLETFGNMTVIELSEFVEAFKQQFNVTAVAAPAMAAPGAVAEAAEAEEEQDEFDVILESFGAKKIQVIKVVREITSLGLKEPRRWSTEPPARSGSGHQEEAEEIKGKLEAVGATVNLK